MWTLSGSADEIDDDFTTQWASVRSRMSAPHVLRISREFRPRLPATSVGAPYIRLFSFFTRPDADSDGHRDEMLRRMRALADVAEEAGVVVVHDTAYGALSGPDPFTEACSAFTGMLTSEEIEYA